MNPTDETQHSAEALSSPEVDPLPATATNLEEGNVAVKTTTPAAETEKNTIQPFDFRNRMLLAPGELRKLRLHQEEFANALAARLSLYLRLEFSLKLTGLQTVAYGKLARSWSNPSHLTLFKIEPLRGVSILEIPPPLGLSIVDRLMGGPGNAPDSAREMSEIENALLDQAVQLILGEWCIHWSKMKELKPVLLGCETNGKFIQTALPETMMLVVAMEGRIGNCVQQIQIGFPYSSLEILIRQLTKGADTAADAPSPPLPKAACKWNPCFDDVRIPLVAEWQGIELTAREILALKVGDVLPINGQCAQQVKVRLADHPKFNGRLGTVAGNWAVELTQVINR
jgi:flagellar motor switch protein FliM